MKRIRFIFNILLSLLLTYNAFGQWNTNGNNVYHFGNVGIGTNNPQQRLDINGYLDQRLRIHAINNTNNPPYYAARLELSGQLYVPNPNSGIPMLSSWKLANINGKFGIHNSEEPAFTITHGRNVGIGTFSPIYKLDVHGIIRSSTSVIKHTGTNKGWRLSTTNGGSDLLFRTDPAEGAPQTRVYLKQNGNVGIGTSDPTARLHILGTDNNGTTATLKVSSGSQNMLIDGNEIDGNNGIYLNHNNNKNVILATGGGRVGIGTDSPHSAYKLSVNGKIRAKEIVVESGWADFVFEKNYKLMPLEEVEAYIYAHKHLPDVPSAKEVEENGVSVGEIEAKLLQKVEELTLYLIELKKENAALAQRVEQLGAGEGQQPLLSHPPCRDTPLEN